MGSDDPETPDDTADGQRVVTFAGVRFVVVPADVWPEGATSDALLCVPGVDRIDLWEIWQEPVKPWEFKP